MTHGHFTVLIRGTTSNEQKDFWKKLENTNIKKSDVLFQQDEGYSVFIINLRMSAENIKSALLKNVVYIDTVSMKLRAYPKSVVTYCTFAIGNIHNVTDTR